MREFVLHDGTDENKTEELHDFMEKAKTVNGLVYNDWEGSNCGISIWYLNQANDHDSIHVDVGDKIIIDENGNVTVEKGK